MTSDGRDWTALGLKVGIEIHQQLGTGKLFCDCPGELVDDVGVEVVRSLRPTQSEMGEVDRASLLEAGKHLQFVYQSPEASSCMVEVDEEPPHDMNEEALEVALVLARLFGARIVDEVHVMRKIVIDGSNTAGFQRTALVAVGGNVPTGMGNVPLEVLTLEEDAARKIEERPGQVVYRLDRLGIPLVEITTGPVMVTPEQVRDVAETIGMVFRATKRVKRGLGTIRQDLNVSIRGGARVEIKGVQELGSIPDIVEGEVERQLSLIRTREELLRRGVSKDGLLESVPVDITRAFKDCRSRVIRGALDREGVVLGTRMPGFKGLMGAGTGFGGELAAYARTVGVKGIFHTDELPGYGITQQEVDSAREALGADREHDAFVMVAGSEDVARAAVEQVLLRAGMAFDGVPEEVRGVREVSKGDRSTLVTEFQRPMPGAARMYPETDIPPIRLDASAVGGLVLPEMPDKRIERFCREYGLSEEQARQLVHGDLDDAFEDLCRRWPDLKGVVARTLLSTIPELEDMGVVVKDRNILLPVFEALGNGLMAKEGVPDVLGKMVAEGLDLPRALEALGLSGGQDMAEVSRAVAAVVQDHIDLIKRRGSGAMGPMMGRLMKEFKGKVDGQVLSDMLKKEMDRVVSS